MVNRKNDWLQSQPYAAENLLPSLVALTLLLNRLFPNIAFLHSSISIHVSMDAILSDDTGLIFTTFYLSFFFSIPPPYRTSQNSSFLVKALSCSLLSCFHYRIVLPHSPLMPFLTEASSLFLHTTYILAYFSHFSSSVLKNPTQCLLPNHLLILVCRNLRH